MPQVSLDQWRALVAVVDAGGYAAAAERIHRSQSAVTYSVKKLEATLAVQVFERAGRRSVLTPTGRRLVQRARALLEEAGRLEHAAGLMSAGWEAQIGIAAEVLFPTWLLLECLAAFGEESPHTHVEVIESVIGGTQEALLDGRADLALTPHIPVGFLGDAIMRLRIVPVAHPDHPLHQLGRPVTARDLKRHRHLVVRETGLRRQAAPSVDAEQRWTVSNMATSIGAACRGYGFSWFPEHKIRGELAEGTLAPLPLTEGAERFITMYLVTAEGDAAGPGVRRLAAILRERTGALTPTGEAGVHPAEL